MNHAVFCVTDSARASSHETDPALSVDDWPEGYQPLVKADGRVLEDRPDLDRELPLAGFALLTLLRLEIVVLGAAA